jgi:1,4-dihydroxy-2-naphthoate octaprenyltransferase
MVSGLITAGLLVVYYLIRLKATSRLASAVPREILCGMIFGLGCVIAPHAFLPADSGPAFLVSAMLLGLVCSANCVLISVWDKEEDIAGNDRSMATSPSRIIPHMARVLTVLILLTAATAFICPWRIHLALCISALALHLMLRFGSRLSQRSLRMLADAVLLSPLLFIFPS